MVFLEYTNKGFRIFVSHFLTDIFDTEASYEEKVCSLL